MGLIARKSSRVCNNTGADQHPRSLTSAFVIRFLENLTFKLATDKISIFYIVSVAKETSLNITLTATLKTGFLRRGPYMYDSVLFMGHICLQNVL